jgi:hypothetical protein
MLTLDDFERLMGASLYATWLETIPWTRETVAGFFAHGIPADYAERIAVITKGTIPVSSWPKVLRGPSVSTLRRHDTERTIRTMDVNTQGKSASVKRGAGRATRKHPAQKRLYERGKTITDIAGELKEGRPRVSSWFADGDTNRPIPRRHAEHLRDRYGIPLNAWLRIAD